MFVELNTRRDAAFTVSLDWNRDTGHTRLVVPRCPSQPTSRSTAVKGARARAVFGPAVFGPASGLVALTVGCLVIGAYMGRDLMGGPGIALSVGAVICLTVSTPPQPKGASTSRPRFCSGSAGPMAGGRPEWQPVRERGPGLAVSGRRSATALGAVGCATPVVLGTTGPTGRADSSTAGHSPPHELTHLRRPDPRLVLTRWRPVVRRRVLDHRVRPHPTTSTATSISLPARLRASSNRHTRRSPRTRKL